MFHFQGDILPPPHQLQVRRSIGATFTNIVHKEIHATIANILPTEIYVAISELRTSLVTDIERSMMHFIDRHINRTDVHLKDIEVIVD